jgi:hypothetical protein
MGAYTRLACLLLLVTMPVFGDVIGFDDLSETPLQQIPSGYHGFTWTNFTVVTGAGELPTSGYATGIVSPGNGAYTIAALPGHIRSTGTWPDLTPFDLNSVYVTAALTDGLQINAVGWRLNSRLYEATMTVDTAGPSLFNLNFLGVTDVMFSSCLPSGCDGAPGGGKHFVIDNVTVNETAPVPEPGTLLLFQSGVALTAALFWNRWKRAR